MKLLSKRILPRRGRGRGREEEQQAPSSKSPANSASKKDKNGFTIGGNAVVVTGANGERFSDSRSHHPVLAHSQQHTDDGPIIETVDLAVTPVDQFLVNFRENSAECLHAAYFQLPHPVLEHSIPLSTSLVEDIIYQIHALSSLIDEYLVASNLAQTELGDAVLVNSLQSMFQNILNIHSDYTRGGKHLENLESCTAAANDFYRISESLEHTFETLAQQYSHLTFQDQDADELLNEMSVATTLLFQQEASSLIQRYISDAVYCSQHVAKFAIQQIQQSGSLPLFGHEWEDTLTQNQVAQEIIKNADNILMNLEHNLVPALYTKSVVCAVRSIVCFYITCFVQKACKFRAAHILFPKHEWKRFGFLNSQRTILRMHYDIQIFRDYFISIVQGNKPLERMIEHELSLLTTTFLECLRFASGKTAETDSLREFIIVVHKHLCDSNVTRHFLSDIWLLLSPIPDEHLVIEDAVREMHYTELERLARNLHAKKNDINNNAHVYGDDDMTWLRLDKALANVYRDRIQQEQGLSWKCIAATV